MTHLILCVPSMCLPRRPIVSYEASLATWANCPESFDNPKKIKLNYIVLLYQRRFIKKKKKNNIYHYFYYILTYISAIFLLCFLSFVTQSFLFSSIFMMYISFKNIFLLRVKVDVFPLGGSCSIVTLSGRKGELLRVIYVIVSCVCIS